METVRKVVRNYERGKNYTKPVDQKLTDSEIQYIKIKYKNTRVEDIARRLRRSVGMIERQICQMMAQGIISNYNRPLNPHPVTSTTKMLICRYYEDNLRKGMTDDAAKYNIACELSRAVATIEEILVECKANGEYGKYNHYGTSSIL